MIDRDLFPEPARVVYMYTDRSNGDTDLSNYHDAFFRVQLVVVA